MDVDLRELERRAALDPSLEEDLIRAKVRAKQPISVYSMRGSGHHQTIFPEADCSEVLKVRAYLGCEESLDLLDHCPLDETYPRDGPHIISPPIYGRRTGDDRYGMGCPACKPNGELQGWLVGLQTLTKNVPPIVVDDVMCRECEGEGKIPTRHSGFAMSYARCKPCKGEGSISHPVVYSHYLEVWAAWEAGKLALELWGGYLSTNARSANPRPVFDAVETWLRCPCPENENAWGESMTSWSLTQLAWLPRGNMIACVLAVESSGVRPEAIRKAMKPLSFDKA